MALPSKTITYANLDTFTRETYDVGLVNEVTYATPFLAFLLETRKPGSWGTKINVPFTYAQATTTDTTVQVYGKTGIQDETFWDDEDSSEFYVEPSWIQRGVAIKQQDQDMNQGQAAIINLLDHKYDRLAEIIRMRLNGMTWSDGSATNSFKGIQYWVSDTPAVGTCANVDRTDTRFQYFIRNIADTTTTLATFNISKLNKLYNDCSAGGGDQGRFPDFFITTQTIWEKLWDQSDTRQRLGVEDKLLARLGWKNIEFNGKPVIWDKNCPAGHFYMLRKKDWEFRVFTNSNMFVSPWEHIAGQEALGKKMRIGGQIICKAPCRQGVMTAVV